MDDASKEYLRGYDRGYQTGRREAMADVIERMRPLASTFNDFKRLIGSEADPSFQSSGKGGSDDSNTR